MESRVLVKQTKEKHFRNTILSLRLRLRLAQLFLAMETLNGPALSSATANDGITGWDDPLTEEELEVIDAAIESARGTASNHKKRRPPPTEDNLPATPRRRLPGSFSRPPSCPVDEEMRYPSMTFGGRILYSRSAVEVEKAAVGLLKKIDSLKRLIGQVTIGFDIEWRPTFRRGAPIRRAAVVQICCSPDLCHVMHIIHSGIPQSLKLVLEDPAVVKVGVGIVNDGVKMQKDYNVTVQACKDLSCLANEKLVGDQQIWGLASLTKILVSKQLPKPKHIRLGNWEASSLSREQLQYAATDAYASWHLYQVLKSLPDLERNNC